MKISLRYKTPLWVASEATRQCWDSRDKSDTIFYECNKALTTGPKDMDLINRIGNQNKHQSILEHIVFSYDIMNISRACLQELARHRIASLSVKSSRYTLRELRKEKKFLKNLSYSETRDKYIGILRVDARDRASKYIITTGNETVDFNNIVKLDMLRVSVQSGIANDISKYEMPECYKTSLTWTINARSLQNFMKLRSSSHALPEIQVLANKLYEELPYEYKYLFEQCFEEYVEITKEEYRRLLALQDKINN